MATGHALSMVTNSCFKLPINPRTRLACSFGEREDLYSSSGNEDSMKTWTDRTEVAHQNGRNAATSADRLDSASTTMSKTTEDLFHCLTGDMGSLSDENFYEKLLELKNEHRKTLKTLETAYNRKCRSPSHTSQQSLQEYQHDPKNEQLHHTPTLHHIGDQVEQFNESMPSWTTLKKDRVRDMSAKPPSGRPQSAWSEQKTRPNHSLRTSQTRNDWHDITWTSDSEGDTSGASEQNLTNNTTSTDVSRGHAFQDSPVSVVKNMWDNFSVDDYAPRSRSGSESRASQRSNMSSLKSQEWSPKITVPKPFKMTTRNTNLEKKKSRACLELDKELEERQKAEEAECQKQFKATPAPATTYLPLYDELKEKQNEKMRQNQEMSKALTKSIQKPFNFMKREEENKRHRTRSLPLACTPEAKAKNKFKARPVPKSVTDPVVAERILEEEEYRKIRIKMRAEEMLRSSSLPQNMQVRGREYTDGHLRQKLQKHREKKAFLTNEHKFHPKVKGDVPDYDQLYRNFQAEVARKKEIKEPTVVQPFNLRTARIPSKKDKVLEEMRLEEEQRKQEARGSLSMSKSGSLRQYFSASTDSIPLKTTTSSVLRKSAADKILLLKAEREREAVEKQRQQRQKEKRLKSMIAQKALANDKSKTLAETNQDKLTEFRKTERSRKEEYELELQQMMSRVESRPFLFETESQTNAQKKAERKYQQALRDAGIDEDFLVRKSRGAPLEQTDVRRDSYGIDDFESSDGGPGGYSGLNSVRSDRSKSKSSARSPYSDDEDGTISSIHTDED